MANNTSKKDNKKVAQVVSSYALTNSYNKTAKETGISDKTVKKIVENNPKLYEDKKRKFYDEADSIIYKALDLLKRRFDTALNNQDEIEELINMVFSSPEKDENNKKILSPKEKLEIAKKLSRLELNSLSEITTAIGTLYDKKRLEEGKSTGNQTFEVNIKVIE